MHLADVFAGPGTQGFAFIHKAERVQLRVFHATAGEFGGVAFQLLYIAPLGNPGGANRRQALAQINGGFRVCVGPRGIVYHHGRVLLATHFSGSVAHSNFPHWHPQIGSATLHVYFS